MLKIVTSKASAAEKVKAEVQKVKDKAQNIVDTIAVDKAAAMAKLEAARPALEAAEAALQTIKPADIATVRKLGKPPHLIMRIMDCVLILFQKRINPVEADPDRPCVKPSWGEALKMMNNSGFLGSLLNFSKVGNRFYRVCLVKDSTKMWCLLHFRFFYYTFSSYTFVLFYSFHLSFYFNQTFLWRKPSFYYSFLRISFFIKKLNFLVCFFKISTRMFYLLFSGLHHWRNGGFVGAIYGHGRL